MEKQSQELNVTPTEPQQSPVIAQPQLDSIPPSTPQLPAKHPRKKMVIIVASAIALVLIIGCAAFYIHKHDSKTKVAAKQVNSTVSTTSNKPVKPASWSIVTSPNFSSAPNNELNGLSCTSSTNCWAVGDYNLDNSTGSKTLIEQWNGKSWNTVSSPNQSGDSGDQLNSVYCVKSSDCWAVGGGEGFGTSMLIEQWNGSSWQLETSSSVTGVGDLLSVTCTSSSNCWAVGDSNQSQNSNNSLVEHWNGSAWTATSTPDSTQGYLDSVTCTSSSNCFTVGDINNNDGSNSLAEQWNGSTWSRTTTPNPNGYENSFSDVECESSSNCMAIGLSNSTTATNFIVTSWNGTSSSNCWIVGNQSTTLSGPTTLIGLHWNGSTWAVSNSLTTPSAPTPVAGAQDGPSPPAFSAISCTEANYCMAVGSYTNATSKNQDTLAELYSSQ
jgi:hypothetical protein